MGLKWTSPHIGAILNMKGPKNLQSILQVVSTNKYLHPQKKLKKIKESFFLLSFNFVKP